MRFQYAQTRCLGLTLVAVLGLSIGCGSSETEPAEPDPWIGEDVLWSVQAATKGAPVTRPVVRPDGMIYVGGTVRNTSGVQACLFEINPDGTIARELLGSPRASKMWVTASSQGTVSRCFLKLKIVLSM